MRLLIACQHCNRQYDASGLEPGRRVRCHCGEVLVVEQPKSHDASVVCCSSCGAPREQNSTYCGHCKSDFTLHELDLKTVCPSCRTRVSDRAKYCHSCGVQLAVEMAAGEISALPCPACGCLHPLRSRFLDKQRVAVMECNNCTGLWLGNVGFEKITKRAGKQARVGREPDKPSPARLPGLKHEAGTEWEYRKCPVCQELMVRRHYGKGSGVIIDFCRTHGTWLDAKELPAILTWIRAGGHQWLYARRAREEQRRQQLAQRAKRAKLAKLYPPDNSLQRRRAVRFVNALCSAFG